MSITQDRGAGRLWLTQEDYIEKILIRFSMKNAKPITTPLGQHFKLSTA